MSRFVEPGLTVEARGDGGAAMAVVLRTSRHKSKCNRDAATMLLAEALLDHLGWPDEADLDLGYPFGSDYAAIALADEIRNHASPYEWRSVTKAELDDEGHYCWNDDLCEAGSWCSEGAGRDWMEVLAFDLSTAEHRLDTEVERMKVNA